MSYLTDKYGSNAAAKAATTSPSKTYGAGTGTVNKSNTVVTPKKEEDKNNGAGKTKTTPTTNTVVNDTPKEVISFNSPSGNNVNTDVNFDEEDEASSYWDEYLAQQARAAAEQKAAIQAAVDQSVNSLNSQKTTTAQDYADAYRQLYLNNMKGQKNIGQQMAAQGITGGASESTLLGMNTNYEDNLRQGKVAEQNALSELDQAIINAQLSGSIEAANANATNAQNTANAYLTAWQQELANQQAQAQLAASQNSENRSYAYQLAMSLLQAGSMPSAELLNTAGISTADAQTIVANYVAAKAASKSPTATEPTTDNAYNDILSSAQWLANYQGKASALQYLKAAYNDKTFDAISGSKKSAYDSMVSSINSMF